MPLKILVASAEVGPFAKVGGLADVAASLPPALRELGHDCRIVMPAYGLVLDRPELKCERLPGLLEVRLNPTRIEKIAIWQGMSGETPVWLIGGPAFERVSRSEEIYSPQRDDYLLFSAAILALCERENWIPDILHANDWHTGFLPVLAREKGGRHWNHTGCVYTIHNLAYQGEFGPDTLDYVGLPQALFNMHQLETFGAVNFLKAGCVYSDQVNTVSPRYAEEIQTPQYGCRLWGLMRDLSGLGRLRGILNGIDLTHFDPASDPCLPVRFSADSLAGKAECKRQLIAELGMEPQAGAPMVGVVSRLSDQKGFDLILRQAYGMLNLPVQFVVVAVGDPGAAAELRKLELEWPDRVRFIERFDHDLGQKVYGASDIFLMPSHFEPCGLGQMIAMRYGAVPVVRKTGGLSDTVFEAQNGFVFEEPDAHELLRAMERAVEAYRTPDTWNQVQQAGMRSDHSWQIRAPMYVELYKDALSARGAAVLVS